MLSFNGNITLKVLFYQLLALRHVFIIMLLVLFYKKNVSCSFLSKICLCYIICLEQWVMLAMQWVDFGIIIHDNLIIIFNIIKYLLKADFN